MHKLIIKGRLKSLNEYISAINKSAMTGNSLKRDQQAIVYGYILECLGRLKIDKKVWIDYHWYEQTKMRDKDNISAFGRKVIQDALVMTRTLRDDGWACIEGFSDRFYIDKENPRIEVIITELGD